MSSFSVKNLLLMLGILLATFPTLSSNVLTLSDISGDPGTIVKVKVSLSSSDNISAIQLTAPVGESISVVEGSCRALNRAARHSVSCGVKDGSLSLMVYSTGMQVIEAGTGEIVEFSVKMGSNPIVLSPEVSAKGVDASGNEISCSANALEISVSGAIAELPLGLSYDFGRIALGATYSIAVPVRNSGSTPLEIRDIEFDENGFFLQSSLPLIIQRGGNGNLEIRYTPTDRGEVIANAKIISNDLAPDMVIKLLASPYAVNELTIGSVSGMSGSEIEIPISLSNFDSVTGFSLEFELPSTLEFVEDSFRLSSRAAGHSLSTSCENGKLSALCYSMTDSPFVGNSGDIASFKVRINGKRGVTLCPTKAVLSAVVKGEVEDVISSVNPATISIRYPSLSSSSSVDFNRSPITESTSRTLAIWNSGSMDLIVERVVANRMNVAVDTETPLIIPPYNTRYLELRLTGEEVGNLTGSLQLYTNDPDYRVYTVNLSAVRYSPNYLIPEGQDVNVREEICEIPVGMSNYDSVLGIQFDLEIPKGFEPEEPLIAERTQGFSINVASVGENKLRYMMYSLSGKEMLPGEGEIAVLKFRFAPNIPTTEYNFTLSDVKLGGDSGENLSSMVDDPVATVRILPYVAVSSLELDKTAITGSVGESFKLTATVLPLNATDKAVVWSSSNPEIVSVDEEGKIVLLAAGTVIITASCGEVEARCTVSVSVYTKVDELELDQDAEVSIFTSSGICLKNKCKFFELKSLTKGIYIVKSEKGCYKVVI